MTDEEILERLAGIEGWVWRDLGVPCAGYRDESDAQPTPNLMNPLTNDAQAMTLVKKYEVLIEDCDVDGWHTLCDGIEARHRELNRAVCLAVIAAHGGGDVDA